MRYYSLAGSPAIHELRFTLWEVLHESDEKQNWDTGNFQLPLINAAPNMEVMKGPRGVRQREVQVIIMSGESNAIADNGILFLGW